MVETVQGSAEYEETSLDQKHLARLHRVALLHLDPRLRGEVVEVEDRLQEPARIAAELQLRLGLEVDVRLVPTMSLPRFEGKGERWIDLRKAK